MSIPIVDRIEDAPEQGDCWVREPYFAGLTWTYVPCRDRLPGWVVSSTYGWNPSAECAEVVEINHRVFEHCVFAATAEEAIAQHLADREKCPFGEVTLKAFNIRTFDFFGGKEHILTFTPQTIGFPFGSLPREGGPALHALLGEVIAFQAACAAGHPEQSAIGRWIKEQGGANA